MKPRLLCITGLTGSGKSALAMELCQRWGAEILSVDSMQVYRGFDVGTAKPTAAERALVPHHGIDLVEPTEPFSAGRFLAYARGVLDSAREEGRTVLAVGGTGLYLRALLHGLAPAPGAQPELRSELRASEAGSPGAMHARLAELDPEAAARLHPRDLVRIERALEVVLSSGRPMSAWQAEHGFVQAPFETRTLAIRWSREAIRERLAQRVDAMLDAGWVDEVRGLLDAGVPRDCVPMKAIGYPAIAAHLAGVDRATTREQIVTAVRRFAKRQATWFNRRPSIEWLDPDPGLAARLAETLKPFIESP